LDQEEPAWRCSFLIVSFFFVERGSGMSGGSFEQGMEEMMFRSTKLRQPI